MNASRLSWSVAAIAFFAGAASAQVMTPNTSFATLRGRTLSVELEGTRFDATSFGRDQDSIEIPGDLEIETTTLRLRYATSHVFAFGVELPYRVVTDRPDLGGTIRARGWPGGALFVDFFHHPFHCDADLRLNYLHARREADTVLTVSDGIDRYSAVYAIVNRSERIPGDGRIELTYGPPRTDVHRYAAVMIQLAAGRRITHDVDALLLVNGNFATLSRLDGSYFDSRTGYRADLGLMLQWHPLPALHVRASATRTVRMAKNIAGSRVTVSLVRTFDFERLR